MRKPLRSIWVHHKWRVVKSNSKYNVDAGRKYTALAPGFLTLRSESFHTFQEAIDFAHKNAVMDHYLAQVPKSKYTLAN